MTDATQSNGKDDSWAQTLAVSVLPILYRGISLTVVQRIAAEREKVQAQEVTGRGVRRRAAAAPQVCYHYLLFLFQA
jgi:hypothetical protein